MSNFKHLQPYVETLPYAPGVYFMKAAGGDILYIGKAKSLRRRVRSYLGVHPGMPKIDILMAKVAGIEYVETPTEVDALLLEAQLVRKYQPHYNKELKDDKSFPLLKITAEPFPRIHITRNKNDKKAVYYGPYTDAKLLREAVSLIDALFPIRKCRRLPKTACLYYHIGQCIAPCIMPEVKPKYDQLISEVRGFLGGGKKSFIDYLTERMNQASEELRFEDAQYYKEQIEALSRLRKKRFLLRRQDAAASLSATLDLKRRLGMEKIPEKIVCFDVSNIQGDQAVASKVSFYRELADKIDYRRYKIKTVAGIHDYAMIQEALRRMLRGVKEGRESFIPDVVMIDGGKGHLHAAYEILREEGFENLKLISIAKRFETIYSVARQESSAGIGDRHAVPCLSPIPAAVDLEIPKDAPVLYLLQKIRDEAHRFAIAYHRGLKRKQLTRSLLDSIKGVGAQRKRVLLKHFDSLESLAQSSADELALLPGMNRAVAEKVLAFLGKK